MWHWQVKKFKELIHKNPLLVIALGLSSAIHLVGLLSFIIGYRNSSELRVTVANTQPANVILMPLVKRTYTHTQSAKASQQKPQTKPTPVTSAKNQKPNKAPQATPTAKKTITTTQDANRTVKPKQPVIAAKKRDTKPVISKPAIKKAEVKPLEIAKKVEKPVSTEKIETKSPENNSLEQPVAVGYEEFAELQMQEYFRQQIISNWSPPPGFGSDVICEMKITISAGGIIDRIDVSRSSGSRAYDTSVKRALMAITVPKWAYNKSVHVCFKQS